MIEHPPKLTLREDWPRPTPAQIAAFESVPASIVSDAMMGRGVLDGAISPVLVEDHVPRHVVGAALPAENPPGAIVATLAALACAQPGDVLVISVSGGQGMAAVGDRVAGMFRNAGGVGIVTDGPVRDADGLAEVGLPVWATGLTPATPHDNGPGRTGLPMTMAGQRIGPGDLVVADRDGVVIVPFEEIDAVAVRVKEVRALEDALDARVRDEGLTVPEGIAEFLRSDDVKRV
ncbi:RraA family protein [Pseudaestuariivita atlantica]|uniref:Putative 4-hydroxy-4-methyl-2-oxoglutarate aldolase n=1 Tax=Pseudaestuariivita atlantica TaxID=1317121 RepID=A0A0L1JS94_9RHOB|nr:hypothetical protein [Pseudaestuariivita atlantica]KNG94659.1 hypothetical protein ATO11_04470 [Pseudaestuariivita atlantica]